MINTATGSKPAFWSLVGICFSALIVLLFLAGVGKAQSEQADVVPVTVEASQLQWQQSFDKIQRVVGRVEASQQANTGFELSGLVANVFVDDGAVVKKGDVLANLDTLILDSQLNQAKASVERAEAQAKLARSSLQRITNLVEANLESQQRLDEAEQSLQSAVASVKEAQASVQTLQVNIDKSVLLAPFDAEILTRFIDEGTVVAQGQPIFEMIATGSQDVRLPMPANLIRNLAVNQTYVLKDGEEGYTAVLRSVGKQRRLATRTVDAVFSLNTDGNSLTPLLPGDLLTLDVKISVEESGAWIPVAALSHGLRGLWNIYSIDKNQVTQVVARSVEVLYSDGQFAFVRGAISPDMQVVVSGTHRLAPGQEVAVKLLAGPDFAERN